MKSQQNIDIEVIVATSNSERYLNECLSSIVNQILPVKAIHVVDNYSTDSTYEIATSFAAVQWHTQQGQGLARAWNQGIQAATADVIAILDSDDYWTPNFLSDAALALHEHEDALCAIAMTHFFVEPDAPLTGFRPELIGSEHVGWMPGVTLFRRAVFDRVGMFPEDLEIASDIEWFARLRELALPYAQIPVVGLHKRMHGDNLSLRGAHHGRYREEILRVVRARRK